MKVRKISIRMKLVILISMVSVISTVGVGIVSYRNESRNLITQAKENGMNIAKCAAAQIDGDMLSDITEDGEQSQEFQTIYNQLTLFRDNAGIEYIYTMKRTPEGSTVFVVDTDPEDPAAIYEEYEPMEGIDIALNGVTSADEEVTTDEWGSYFSTYSPIYDKSGAVAGIVGVDISVEEINTRLAAVRNMIAMESLIFILLGVICAVLISSSIGRNLKRLNEKVCELNSGDGDLTRKLLMKSGDELEVISNNMNQFIENIHLLISNIASISNKLYEDGNQLSESVNNDYINIGEINEKVGELSAGMEECSASNDVILGELDHVAESVNGLKNMTSDMRVFTDQMKRDADTMIKDAHFRIDDTKTQMNEIDEKVQEAERDAEKIALLQTMAQRIEEIAGQTRILSLNARVEAARAGESGQGFTVVAQKVGELSNEIESAVKEMNGASEVVVTAMMNMWQQTEAISSFIHTNVMKDYENMVTIGTKYEQSADTVFEKMQQIETDTAEITNHIFDVKNSLTEIDHAVNDSTQNVMEVKLLSDEINENMSLIMNMAQSNKNSSEQLEQEIGAYHYNN